MSSPPARSATRRRKPCYRGSGSSSVSPPPNPSRYAPLSRIVGIVSPSPPGVESTPAVHTLTGGAYDDVQVDGGGGGDDVVHGSGRRGARVRHEAGTERGEV